MPASTVDVWSLPPTGFADLHVLDDDESAIAASFFDSDQAHAWIAAHVGVRRVLAGYLSLTPGEVQLARACCTQCGKPHGRPIVRSDPSLHYSLSHTDGMAVVAVSRGWVGVDIEPAGRRIAAELLPLLHPAERTAVLAVPGRYRDRAFLHCWTRKEALVKATGTGLTQEPSDILVGLGPGFDGLADVAGGWTIRPLDWPTPDFIGSVAAPAGPLQLQLRELHEAFFPARL